MAAEEHILIGGMTHDDVPLHVCVRQTEIIVRVRAVDTASISSGRIDVIFIGLNYSSIR